MKSKLRFLIPLLGLAAAAPAHADLLFYENFNSYTAGGADIDGQGGWSSTGDGTGAKVQSGSYSTGSTGSWDGTSPAIPTSGGNFYVGDTTGNTSSSLALSSTVTNSFAAGATTWFSFVAYQGNDGASARWAVTIGDDVPDPGTGGLPGQELNGQGLGAGQLVQSAGTEFHYWIPNPGGADITSSAFFGGGRPVFTMLKIDWAANGNDDTITMYRWDQNMVTTPTLSNWDNASKLTVNIDLDQTNFDTLGIVGNPHGWVDEIRIATTFDDAVTGTVVGGADEDPPLLSSTSPAAGATEAPVSGNLVATFNEEIQAGDSGSVALWRVGTPDVLVESFDVTPLSPQLTIAVSQVTIDPTNDLTPGEDYYVLIDAGAVKDTAGNAYAGLSDVPPAGGAWSFTADATAPTLSSTEPAADAPNVNPNAPLTLTFDEDVLAGSGNITVHLSGGSVVQTIDVTSGVVSIDGNVVTINIASLDLDTSYYVNIPGTAFTDLSGNEYVGLGDTTTWAFTTFATALLHHWTFDGDATDSVGDHDGTLAGDAAYGPGILGQAVSLDGAGDYVQIGQESLPATDFTLTAWIYRETNGGFMYIAGTQLSGNEGAFMRMDEVAGDGQLFVNLLPPATSLRAAGGSVAPNTWTHVAATVSSSGGLKLYVNGSEVGPGDPTATGHTPYNNFRIGARPDTGGDPFDGLIDDVRIYAVPLSAGEIADLAVAPATGYSTWSGGEPFDGDKNGDTVDNGIAFLLGAVGGPDANALDLLPTSSEDGSGGLVLNFSCLNAANRGTSQLRVEHSSDLGISDDWSGALVPDVAGPSGPVNGVLFDVILSDPLNSVTATISSTEAVAGKVFGRLSGME